MTPIRPPATVRQDQVRGSTTGPEIWLPSTYDGNVPSTLFTSDAAEGVENTLVDDLNRLRTLLRIMAGSPAWWDQFSNDGAPYGALTRRIVMRSASIALDVPNRVDRLSYDKTLSELSYGMCVELAPCESTLGIDGHFRAYDPRYAGSELVGIICRTVPIDPADGSAARYASWFDICTAGDSGIYRLLDGTPIEAGILYYAGNQGELTSTPIGGAPFGIGVFSPLAPVVNDPGLRATLYVL